MCRPCDVDRAQELFGCSLKRQQPTLSSLLQQVESAQDQIAAAAMVAAGLAYERDSALLAAVSLNLARAAQIAHGAAEGLWYAARRAAELPAGVSEQPL